MTDQKSNGLRMYAVTSREALAAMGGNRGKLAAQAGHAYLHAFWDAEVRFGEDAYPTDGGLGGDYPLGSGHSVYAYQRDIKAYRHSGAAVKVTLVVDTTDELAILFDLFRPVCGTTLVKDAGRTVFKEPTVTFVGIGPITREAFEDLAPGLRPLL